MELEKVEYKSSDIQISQMKGGDGDFSYAKNSSWQKEVILKAMPLIQESINGLFCESIPECLKIADMGCSSGPTGYLPTWQVIEAIDSLCRSLNCKPPMLQVFLNDLPGNDFNTLFNRLPSFHERLKKEKGDEFGECTFIAAVPGSFYGRLFPNNSLSLIIASCSLIWLSQAPKGLISDTGVSLNKENIFITKTSPPSVHKAYLDQFESDFTAFLRSRQNELQVGGRVILTFVTDDTYHPCIYALLGLAINDLVSQGLIEESKLESFNMPVYMPRDEEIRLVIEREGSFDIHQLQIIFNENWVVSSSDSDTNKGKEVACFIRSIVEPLLVTHFGSALIDHIFHKFSVKVTEYLETEAGFLRIFAICLIKK